MKSHFVVAGVLAVVAQPASAQSLGDTFRSLKKTGQQLANVVNGKDEEQAKLTNEPVGNDHDGLVDARLFQYDASDSSLADQTIENQQPVTFDIKGFKLGMSPREVARVSKARHIYANDFPAQRSGTFELEAARAANRSLSKPIKKSSESVWRGQTGDDDRGNHIAFKTTLLTRGPVLSHIYYTFPLEGQTKDQFVQDLISKYGEPSSISGNRYLWNSPAEKKNVAIATKPFLQVEIGGIPGVRMTLDYGTDFTDAARMEFDKRVASILASTGRKADF